MCPVSGGNVSDCRGDLRRYSVKQSCAEPVVVVEVGCPLCIEVYLRMPLLHSHAFAMVAGHIDDT